MLEVGVVHLRGCIFLYRRENEPPMKTDGKIVESRIVR